MSKINDGGPFHPTPNHNQPGQTIDGASLRDWFAAQAPTAELRLPDNYCEQLSEYLGYTPDFDAYQSGHLRLRVLTKARYEWADAMIAAREAGK